MSKVVSSSAMIRSSMSALAMVLFSFNASGNQSQTIQLDEREVACQPAGNWLYQFPAISQDFREIALLTDPDPISDIVSLQIHRLESQTLVLESDLPLFVSRHVNWGECVEELEGGSDGDDSSEIVRTANDYLADGQFRTMLPLDAKNTYGITLDTLPSQPEEVISWMRFHSLFDYRQSKLVVSELVSADETGVLAQLDYELGERYLDLHLSEDRSDGSAAASEDCEGLPVPANIWVGLESRTSNRMVFLIRVELISSEECSFPGRWIAKSIEQ